ncbi:MAG: hypothetical protein ACFNQI_08130 [Eikenella corrodens]
MSRPKNNHIKLRAQRLPRDHSPKAQLSECHDTASPPNYIPDYIQACTRQHGGVRKQHGDTIYTTSWIGMIAMVAATLAGGVLLAFLLMAPLMIAGLPPEQLLILLPPFALFWLWLTESWWFGLTTRTFAKITPGELILYGTFGRVRQTYNRQECSFRGGVFGLPYPRYKNFRLYARRPGQRFARSINLSLCANPAALIKELVGSESFILWPYKT